MKIKGAAHGRYSSREHLERMANMTWTESQREKRELVRREKGRKWGKAMAAKRWKK